MLSLLTYKDQSLCMLTQAHANCRLLYTSYLITKSKKCTFLNDVNEERLVNEKICRQLFSQGLTCTCSFSKSTNYQLAPAALPLPCFSIRSSSTLLMTWWLPVDITCFKLFSISHFQWRKSFSNNRNHIFTMDTGNSFVHLLTQKMNGVFNRQATLVACPLSYLLHLRLEC